MKHYGDICLIDGHEVPSANVVIGGSPCQDLSLAGKRAGLAGERSGLFMEQIRVIKEMREKDAESGRTGADIRPRFMVWENVCFDGETIISTKYGVKPIKDIEVGELVLTHKGRYMPVCQTYITKEQKCMRIYCGGEPIICTENHPFLATKAIKGDTSIVGYTEPKFVRACELTKDHRLLSVPDTPELPDDFISDADAWAVGRWIADGSVDLKKSNPRIFISVGNYKIEYAREKLSGLQESIYENKVHKTCTNFCFTSRRFYELIKDCGVGAANKKFPPYVFVLPAHKQAIILDGYLSGDGCVKNNDFGSTEINAGSVSKQLAYDVSRLIRIVYGVPSSVYRRAAKDHCINGRLVKANYDSYFANATISEKTKDSRLHDYIMHRIVKIEHTDEIRDVYNISVLEDNTYVANGMVVHNCGAFSANGGRDFAAVLEETIRVVQPEIPDIHVPENGWTLSGAYVGDGFSVAWRVLDAQFWGVPQRRRRIALVADFGGECAPEILFKSSSSSRYLKPRKEERERTSGDASDRSGTASRSDGAEVTEPVVLESNQNHATITDSGVSPTLSASMGMGGGYVPMITDTVAIEGNGTRESHKGDGYVESDKMYTLNTVEQHSVCYGISAYESNAMLSDNPHSGVYEAETARTLDLNGGNPACNQGGIAIVERSSGFCPNMGSKAEGIGYAEEQAPTIRTNCDAAVVYPETARTLTARNDGSPCVDRGPDVICLEMTSTKNTVSDDGVCPTLTARMGTGGNQVNAVVQESPEVDTFAMQGFGDYIRSDVGSSCKARDFHDATDLVCAVDCRNGTENPHTNGTLQAKDNGGTSLNLNNVVRQRYVVRRLTPLECTRLQGFPEAIMIDLSKMTKDEYIAWNLAEGNIIADADSGTVYTTRGPGGTKLDHPKELKGSNVNGYRVVSIRNGEIKLQCRVHRIIWISVHGILPDGMIIDHINNDKQDNRICNLQMMTPEENSHKAKEDGLYRTGLDSPTTKLDPALHKEISFLYHTTDLTQKQLAEMYGISKSRIGQITQTVGWLDIGDWYDDNGKLHKESDSVKYKALGNSIAIPPWLFVLGSLNEYCEDKTMASLFDGISGFPLIWSFLNGKENCVWSSEVDSFCRAVARIRFPDTSDDKPEETKKITQ